jgi:hypothetical protein
VVATIHFPSILISIPFIGSPNPGKDVLAIYPTSLNNLISPFREPIANPPDKVVLIWLNCGFVL